MAGEVTFKTGDELAQTYGRDVIPAAQSSLNDLRGLDAILVNAEKPLTRAQALAAAQLEVGGARFRQALDDLTKADRMEQLAHELLQSCRVEWQRRDPIRRFWAKCRVEGELVEAVSQSRRVYNQAIDGYNRQIDAVSTPELRAQIEKRADVLLQYDRQLPQLREFVEQEQQKTARQLEQAKQLQAAFKLLGAEPVAVRVDQAGLPVPADPAAFKQQVEQQRAQTQSRTAAHALSR